jgi:hypothetical protein
MSAVAFVFLAMLGIASGQGGVLIATLTNPATTPGFVPTVEGIDILGPINYGGT